MTEHLIDDRLPLRLGVIETLQPYRHAEIGQVVTILGGRVVDQQPGFELDLLPLIKLGRQQIGFQLDVRQQAHPVVGVHLANGLPGARHGVADGDEILILEGQPAHVGRRHLAHIELAAIGPHQDHRRGARLARHDEGDLLHPVIDAKAIIEQGDVGGGKYLVGPGRQRGQQQQAAP